MKVVDNPPKSNASIDYPGIGSTYNTLPVGASIEMPQVYNITLFKRYLSNWGNVKSGVDFRAYNVGEFTYLVRLSLMDMKPKSSADQG